MNVSLQDSILSSLFTKDEFSFLSKLSLLHRNEHTQIYYNKNESKVVFFHNGKIVSFEFPIEDMDNSFLINRIYQSCLLRMGHPSTSIQIYNCSIPGSRIYSTVTCSGRGQYFVGEHEGKLQEFYLTCEQICTARYTDTFETCLLKALKNPDESYTLSAQPHELQGTNKIVWKYNDETLIAYVAGKRINLMFRYDFMSDSSYEENYEIQNVWSKVYTDELCEMILLGKCEWKEV